MNVENRCAAAGCIPAACCRDVNLSMDQSQFVRFSAGVAAEEVSLETFQVVQAMTGVGSKEPTVFYAHRATSLGEQVLVHVRNECPHLDPATSDCLVYEQPARPNACSNLAIGSGRCNQARQRSGFPPT